MKISLKFLQALSNTSSKLLNFKNFFFRITDIKSIIPVVQPKTTSSKRVESFGIVVSSFLVSKCFFFFYQVTMKLEIFFMLSYCNISYKGIFLNLTISCCASPSSLKLQSCKLYNNKHIIASKQTRNTEILEFIAILVISYLAVKFCL